MNSYCCAELYIHMRKNRLLMVWFEEIMSSFTFTSAFTYDQIKIKNKGFQNPETLARLVPRAGIEPAHHLSDTGF